MRDSAEGVDAQAVDQKISDTQAAVDAAVASVVSIMPGSGERAGKSDVEAFHE